MKQDLIISIGRQFGAGGRGVGKLLAKKLGIEYYDKELITLAAQEFGFDSELLEKVDEKSSNFSGNLLQWIESIVPGEFLTKNYLSSDALFEMQSNAIRKLAEERSCVIVGRCSDYVLRNNPNCISVFLHSTLEDRIQRICERSGMSEQDARNEIKIEDRRRAAYYNFYSDKLWGESSTYSLCIDVSKIGIEGATDLIINFLEKRLKTTNT